MDFSGTVTIKLLDGTKSLAFALYSVLFCLKP